MDRVWIGCWAEMCVQRFRLFHLIYLQMRYSAEIQGLTLFFYLMPVSIYLNPVFLFDAGVYLPLLGKTVNVYFPLIWSGIIKSEYSANGWKYNRAIRFTFDLAGKNPFRAIKNING